MQLHHTGDDKIADILREHSACIKYVWFGSIKMFCRLGPHFVYTCTNPSKSYALPPGTIQLRMLHICFCKWCVHLNPYVTLAYPSNCIWNAYVEQYSIPSNNFVFGESNTSYHTKPSASEKREGSENRWWIVVFIEIFAWWVWPILCFSRVQSGFSVRVAVHPEIETTNNHCQNKSLIALSDEVVFRIWKI